MQELPTSSAPVLLSTTHPDGGAAVLSIHEQSNGNITNHDQPDSTVVSNGDLINTDTEAPKENGLYNSINGDDAAVGFNQITLITRTYGIAQQSRRVRISMKMKKHP